MDREKNIKRKLSRQINKIIFTSFVKAVIISLLVGTSLFKMLETNAGDILECYAKFHKRSFQRYVTNNKVNSDDYDKINNWRNRRIIKALLIYDNDKMLYYDALETDYTTDKERVELYNDNQYTPSEMIITLDYNSKILFHDGKEYTVYFLVDYYIQIDVSVIIFSLLIGVIFYSKFFLSKFKEEILYIDLLNDEVRLFKEGNKNRDFTIKGDNEITILATTLNSMKKTIQDKEKMEEMLKGERERLIIGMAHDLKTPMTSLNNYVEALKLNRDVEKTNCYLDKIIEITSDMDNMANKLYEYSLIKNSTTFSEKDEEQLEDSSIMEDEIHTDRADISLNEYINEIYLDLTAQGFEVDLDRYVESDKVIKFCDEYFSRIILNIISNIIKYAEKKHPIIVESKLIDNEFRIYIKNTISDGILKIKGTRIGVENIKLMMDKMDGYCNDSNDSNDVGNNGNIVYNDGKKVGREYCIILAFRLQQL